MWNAYAASHYFVGGEPPTYESMPLNGGTHYDYYRTSDGRYMSVGSLEPKFWEGFCHAIGRPDFIDRLDLPGPKMDVLKSEIREVMAQKTFDEWVAVFADYDVCVEPVLDLAEAFEHPHCRAREMVVGVPKPDGATQRQVAFPIKFSKAQARYEHIGCELGAHTDAVLHEAGYTESDITALRENGVFG